MKTAIALGTFDGVHKGHRSVISEANKNGNSLVLAFSRPPKSYFCEEGIILTDEERKTQIIKSLSVRQIEYLDFSKVKDIKAEDFFKQIVKKYNPEMLCCGENYSFGKDGTGDTELLKRFCTDSGIKLKIVESVKENGEMISSSLIRKLLLEGNIQKANSLLMSDFSFSSEVIHGDKRGREIGFPTVNQLYPKLSAGVKRGVYRSLADIDGKLYNAVSNIGIRPTFLSRDVLCETHILNFSKEIYGKNIRIYLKDFIREEKKFSNLEELKKAIENDCKNI